MGRWCRQGSCAECGLSVRLGNQPEGRASTLAPRNARQRFESESGVARSRVRSIERVQSLLLWTKYTKCGRGGEAPFQPLALTGVLSLVLANLALPPSLPSSTRRPTSLRAEITLQVNKQGAALNERRLFHGADKASAGVGRAG